MSNSKRKCKHCKEYVSEFIRVPAGTFCTFKHAAIWALDKNEEKRKRQVEAARKEQKQKDKITKEELNKTVKHWRPKADTAFQLFCRLIDYGEPCMSCGRYEHEIKHDSIKGLWDGGHYISKGAAPELRYSEDNCHKQCKHCNRTLSGNAVKYRDRLINKIGIHRVEILEGPHELPRWSWYNYKSVYEWYNSLNKIIKKELALT